MPVTIPVDDPIVAMPVDPEFHVPPPASIKDVVRPAHTTGVPLIADGSAFTVTIVVAGTPHPVE